MNRQHLIVSAGLALSLVAFVSACVTWGHIYEMHGDIVQLRSENSTSTGDVSPCATSPRLGDRMNTIARRFAGIWYAGKSENVELAEYELHEIEEDIEDIELLRPIENGVDVFNVFQGVANSQFHDLRAALSGGRSGRF